MVIITLTTDLSGMFPAMMKGEILKINPNANIVDISHSIAPWNIQEGAYVLYTAVSSFPYAIHVGVVDPGVGGKRKELIFDCERGILIGPDNGLLAPAAERLSIKAVYRIDRAKLKAILQKRELEHKISRTFHGKDIFARVAALLSTGVNVEEIGTKVEKYEKKDYFGYSQTEREIKGRILYIEKQFGNIITNIPENLIMKNFKFGDLAKIKVKGKAVRAKFVQTYEKGKKGALLFTITSSGFFEIACREGRAIDRFKGVKIGDKIIVQTR